MIKQDQTILQQQPMSKLEIQEAVNKLSTLIKEEEIITKKK